MVTENISFKNLSLKYQKSISVLCVFSITHLNYHTVQSKIMHFIFIYRHVSFVDCPGHDILMATMLNGAAVMDAALLLIGTVENILKFSVIF